MVKLRLILPACGWLLAALLLAGCATDTPAPVTDYSIGPAKRAPQPPPSSYVVRPGDTLYSIAFRYGVDFRTLARWNDINAPYTIYPGQRLAFRPGEEVRVGRTDGPRQASGVVTEPLPEPARPPETAAPAETAEKRPAEVRREAAPTPAPEHPAPQPAPPPPAMEEPESWRWPARGPVLSRFSGGDSARNGIDIGGEEGGDVVATAPGLVVYSGSGLIGYGELIIVKHGNSYLSAYGHNRKRLVNEGERVEAGQRIAEMGSTGAPRPMVHFEIRRDGKPVDPLRFLPDR